LKGSWCGVNYLLSTPQLKLDAFQQPLPIVADAYNRSNVLISFSSNYRDYEIRKVDNGRCFLFHHGQKYEATAS
jgi:hypothetical protein